MYSMYGSCENLQSNKLWLNKFRDHVYLHKIWAKATEICISQQFSSNSHENLKMLSSINLEIMYISTKFEPKQQKICISQQFSSDSHENLWMLSPIKLEITHISTKFSNILIFRDHPYLHKFWAKATENLHLAAIFWQFSRESINNCKCLAQ